MNIKGKVARLFSDNKMRGTAWLFSTKHALTAAHCVRMADGIIYPNLILEFYGLNEKIPVTINNVDTDLLLDWDIVILTVQKECNNLRELVIPILNRKCQCQDKCYIHGHPAIDSERNLDGFSLKVEVINPEHLFFFRTGSSVEVIQFANMSAWKNLEGISGAPILINNKYSIGVVSEHREDDESNLYGIPIYKIAELSSIISETLSLSNQEAHPFHTLPNDTFKNLCRDLFTEQPGISTCETYGTKEQNQYGVDFLAYRSDSEMCEVGKCLFYENCTPSDIKHISNSFLKYLSHWANWKIRRFILFAACDLSEPKHQDQIRKEKARFRKNGIDYEVWSPITLRHELRAYPGIVETYFENSEYWIKQICGHRVSVPNFPNVFQAKEEHFAINNQFIESLQNTLSSHNKKIIEECRELVRKGKNKEAFRQVKEIGNSQEWPVLNKKIQADILVFEASLVLQIEKDINAARQLVLQAKGYYPPKDMTIIQALLSYYEKDAEAALNEIQYPDNIEKINLKAGIFLEIGRISEAISLIKNTPKKISQNAETLRVLSLAYLASGKLSHARYEIQKAIEEKPDWLGIRIASAMINYFSALSPAALPHGLPTFPDPIGLNLINRDDESLSRLRHAEELFRQIAKEMKDETESRKTFQIWRLACLFNHPDRQTEAHEFCHDLLKDGKAHTGVIIWAVVQNIDYDFSEYKREYENLLEFDDIEIDKIIALLLIYLHSEDTGKALSLLDRTKDIFSYSPDPLLWLFWKVQTLLKSGNIRTALTLAESSGDHRFQQTVFALALKYAEPESEEWQYILSYLESYAKESADGEMLFRICSAKAGCGDQKSWQYVALHAFDLVEKVKTSEAVRLSAIALFNTGEFEKCLQLLNQYSNCFPSNSLTTDLRRIRVQCQIECGILSEALIEAKNVADADPSFENLLALLEAQYFHGNRWDMISSAQKLLHCEKTDSFSLIRTAKRIQLEELGVAQQLWRKALSIGIDDNHISEVCTLGFSLGLEEEVRPLMKKVGMLIRQGKGNVQSVGLQELIGLQKSWIEESNKVWRIYETGKAPIHLIAKHFRWALASLYLKKADNSINSFNPLQQPITFVRYGGRTLNEKNYLLDTFHRIFMDITAFLMAAYLDILEYIEKYFKKIYISPALPIALTNQKYLLANHQPSRLKSGQKIIDLFDSKKLSIVKIPDVFINDIEDQMGKLDPERAYLLCQAKKNNGYMVTFLPLTSYDVNQLPVALSDEDNSKIINAGVLVFTLFQHGRLTEQEYYKSIDNLGTEGHPSRLSDLPQICDSVYLTSGITRLLANADLLEMICQYFKVNILQADISRAKDEISADRDNKEMIARIGILSDRLNTGVNRGVYEFIQISKLHENNTISEKDSPDFLSLSHLLKFTPQKNDLIWIDDRHMNSFLTRDGLVPIIGINEILILLKSKNLLSEEEYYSRILSLRAANFRYIPIHSDEIIFHLKQAALKDGIVVETSAMRILSQYLSACLTDSDRLQLPPIPDLPNPHGEAAFVLNTNRAINNTLVWIWKESENKEIAAARSDWLFENMYFGIFGVHFLSSFNKSQDNMLKFNGLDIAGLISQGISLFDIEEYKKTEEEKRLNWYFEWLEYRILLKRFRSDPNITGIAVELLKSSFTDMAIHESSEISSLASLIVLRDFFLSIPKTIKEKLSEDNELINFLDIRYGHTVRLVSYDFETHLFHTALAEVAKGNEATISDFTTGKQFIVKPIADENNDIISFCIKMDGSTDESRMTYPFFQLLSPDIQKRERLLRDHRDWFDCDKQQFEEAVAQIVSTENAALRVQRTHEWYNNSASVYYKNIEIKIYKYTNCKRDELLPPNLECLLRHLRFPKPTGKKLPFNQLIQESAKKLIQDEGLLEALHRLSGFPASLPSQIFDEISKLERNEKFELFNTLKTRWYSPVSKIHLLHLTLSATDGNDEFFKLSNDICNDLSDCENTYKEFKSFHTLLQWVYDQFCFFAKLENLPLHFILPLTWFHSNNIYNLFRKAQVPPDFFTDEFGNSYIVPLELFDRNLSLWNDICHPRRIRQNTFYFKGLAYAFKNTDEKISKKFNIFEFINKIVYFSSNENKYPAPELFLNISSASNSMNAYLGTDISQLEWLVGQELATQFSAEKLNKLVLDIILELEKKIDNYQNWSLLYGVISDLPVNEQLSTKLNSLIEQIDLSFLKDKDIYLTMFVLFTVINRLNSYNDDSRKRIHDQIVDLVKYYADNKPESRQQNRLSHKGNLTPDIKAIILESVFSASIIEGNPELSCMNFSKQMFRIVHIWPEFACYARPIIFRLVNELPADQEKHLWKLFLTIRSYR
ncbi:MAG: hypothetical protein AB7S75_06985 [Desulfococcaceae bacterium]